MVLVGEVAKQAPLNIYLSLETNKPVFEVLYTLSFTSVMKPSEFNTNMMQTDLNMYEIFGPNRLWILLNSSQNLPELNLKYIFILYKYICRIFRFF